MTWVVNVNSGGRVCEGGQVWGHARRRGYAAAEIWPKSDFDIGGGPFVTSEQGSEGGSEQGNQNYTSTRTSEGVMLNTTEHGSNL